MLSREILLAVLAALSVNALPLNINLGAYSPALVVGDGEISFGNNPEQASRILQTLATGAVNGAVANGQIAPGHPLASSTQNGRASINPAMDDMKSSTPAAVAPNGDGIASPLVTPTTSEQASPIPDVNVAAPAIVADSMGSQLPAEYISHAISGTKYPNMVKSKNKNKSKRNGEIQMPEESYSRLESENRKLRRDLQGFREALAYANEAQQTAPKIEMAFGITQSPGLKVPVNSAANGAMPPTGVAPPVKREANGSAPEPEIQMDPESEKLGVTLIAISEI